MTKVMTHLSEHPYHCIEFDKIQFSQFLPTLKEEVKKAEGKLNFYRNQTEVTYKSVIEDFEDISESIDLCSSLFYFYYSTECVDEIQKDSESVSALLTDFSSNITLCPKVFSRIQALYDKREQLDLSQEQAQILEKYYLDFTRNGALLSDEKKQRLRAIDIELSRLSLEFSKNNLNEVKNYYLLIEKQEDLVGLPDHLISRMASKAKEKNLDGWIVTLDMSMSAPFMQYAQNRNLREKFWRKLSSKSYGGEFCNQKNVQSIVKLRAERAALLGYKNHGDFVLARRMAKDPETVQNFTEKIYQSAVGAAKNELKQLQSIAKELDGLTELKKWDVAYYTEKLKQKVLDFDDEVLRPYFPLNNVLDGLLAIAGELFDLQFEKLTDVTVYQDDVWPYQVRDTKSKEHIGLLYLDLFPRDTKKQGAWMNPVLDQGLFQGKNVRPIISVVCNFTKPADDKPALLSYSEVTTLFHEFGHALHGLLSHCQYRTLSGTNVFWDFVELPSQIMENWALEKESLDKFAAHYQTGEKIPSKLMDKIQLSKQFMEGLMTLRQLSFATLDLKWHTLEHPVKDVDILDFEKGAMEQFSLLEREGSECMSTGFSHLFSGGYSAGYYSYKWAEVLDADAFELFKEKGIFDKETARSFKENILSKGGTQDPMELYKNFRGAEPSMEPLLKRAGLI